MVTATSLAARPTSDELALVRQLGTLLFSRAVIERRRWRAYATARLVPVFALYNLPLDRLREELREANGIVCPEPLQPVLASLLETELARDVPRLPVLSRVLEARWQPDWAGCAFTGMAAALHADAHSTIVDLPALVPDLALRRRLRVFAVSGAVARHGEHGAWGEFHGNLDAAGSEGAFPATPSLVRALVETVIAQRAGNRIEALEQVASRLGALDRRRAAAHIARAVLVTRGSRAAELRLRALRDDSVRDAGWFLVTREATRQGDEARRFAANLRSPLLQHRARIAIAWQVFRAGEPLRARRALGGDVLPSLAFEHWRLRTTIALRLRGSQPAVWPHGLLADTHVAPAWFGEPVVEPETRAQMLLGTQLSRMRDHEACRRVAPIKLGGAMRSPVTRREVIELFDDVGLDAFSTISRLREGAAPDRLQRADILFAELIATRAEAIVAARAGLPRWVCAGIAGDRPPTTQASLRTREHHERRRGRDNIDALVVAELLGAGLPHVPVHREAECPPAAERRIALDEQRSLERALYDEGSSWKAPRRLGILTAARACLRGAVEQPDAWDPILVECRARTLGLLGGRQARDVVESALANSHHDRYTLLLFETLCWIDLDAATRLAIARATAIRDEADPVVLDVLSLVECYRGLPRGFTRAWAATYRALATRLGRRRSRGFLADLVELRGIPTTDLLGWVAARASDEILLDARSVLALAHDRCEALKREWPVDAARKLADDRVLRETLHLVSGVQVVTRSRAWGDAEWTKLLRRAASVQTGVVDRAVVRRCAQWLGCDEDRLLAGDLVGLGARPIHVIDDGLRLRVRLLAKRGDLLQYLRFADVPIANCYRSDSSLYGSSQNDTIAVWKDPLSMCFRIERADGRPFGFVFGNFAELATGGIALTINGLYLARQRLDARTAVLRAIERMLCAPLGIRHIGVGNQFAGDGPFPADYQQRSVTATRLRALRVDGKLVTDAWDDISYDVNVPGPLLLYWRTS